MTLARIKVLTDWLISLGWSAGAIGRISKGSPVWKTLDERSGGLYALWREEFGDLLLHEHEREPVEARRERSVFRIGPEFDHVRSGAEPV